VPRADVILNPVSGSSGRERALRTFRGALERGGWEVRLRPTARAGHAPELARLAADEGADVVVAAGGDGTIHEVASGLLPLGPSAPPLALLPRGTSNLVAREIGAPFDPSGAARLILARAVRALDVVDVGDRTMLACAGAGWDAHVVRELAARRTGHIRVWTWFAPIRSAIRDYAFPAFRVTAAGGPPVECVLALFLNCRPYARFFVPAPQARPDDGLLDAVLVRPEGRDHLARLAWRAWRGDMTADAAVTYVRAPAFRVESAHAVPVQVDGEVGGHAPVDLTVRPRALRFVVPA
jgi:diacylglycerol kinase (ATP)